MAQFRQFNAIYSQAAERHGGVEKLEKKLSTPAYQFFDEPAAQPSRWLASMTRCIFNAGFNWRVIDGKWAEFEAAFWNFEPRRVAHMSEAEFDALLANRAIVRHAPKIDATRKNAQWFLDLEARLDQPVSDFFSEWPAENFADLILLLKKEGHRLGGNTGQYAMRFAGKDSFIMSKDVVSALQRDQVIDKFSLSKNCLYQIQSAYNAWMAESGKSLTQINRILAFSCGDIRQMED